jgi:hypothetical protein
LTFWHRLKVDPSDPEHQELNEWAPIDFDPDYFDVEEASLAMRSPRPLEAGRDPQLEDILGSGIDRHQDRDPEHPPDRHVFVSTVLMPLMPLLRSLQTHRGPGITSRS